MVLTNAANAGSLTGTLTVTGGVLGAPSDAALGDPGNGITLNGATAGFLATQSFATSRTFTFSNATPANNILNVAAGQTLTLNSQLTGANGFQKSDPGILLLTNNTSTIAGQVIVSGGILRTNQPGALGAASSVAAGQNNEGTAFQLDGSGGAFTFARPITLSGGTGIENYGALQNLAGANTVSSAITLSAASTIGNSDAANALALTGGISGAFGLTFNGAGNINVSTTAIGAVNGMARNGSGSTNISVASPLFVTAMTVNQGT